MNKLVNIAGIALVTLNSFNFNGVLAASPTPVDRFYANFEVCDPAAGGSDPYQLPCFTCINFQDLSGGSETRRVLQSAIERRSLNGITPKSMYIHCGGNVGEVYRITYLEADCKGAPFMDEIIHSENECPDCSGCVHHSDCGAVDGCDQNCCLPPPDCAMCPNKVSCDMFGEEECGGCPGCSNTDNPYCSTCTHQGMCGMMGEYCTGCPGCANPNPNCAMCTDSVVCASMMGGCSGCPDCSKAPDPCKLCTDSSMCDYFGEACDGCSGCSVPPDPCKSCTDDYYCDMMGAYCNGCSGCEIPHDPCASCTNAAYCNTPAVCDPSCEVCQGRRLESPEHPQFFINDLSQKLGSIYKNSRVLDESSQNETFPVTFGSVEQDTSKSYAFAQLSIGDACVEKGSGGGVLPMNTCMDFPPIDNETYAILANCIYGENNITVELHGFGSKDDCNANTNELLSGTVADGECFTAPSNLWSVQILCTGWGVKPEPPVPELPHEGDIAVAVRMKYPDRRCEPGTGIQSLGDLRQCDTCISEGNGVYSIYDCTNKNTRVYSDHSCDGIYATKPFVSCDGKGIVRGIFNDEVDYGTPESYAFFTAYSGDHCYAERVMINAGSISGACTQVKSEDLGQDIFFKVDCASRTLNGYIDKDCSASIFETNFADSQCSSIPGVPNMKFMASCSGYLMAPTTPPTSAPSLSPTNAPTYDPISLPSKNPVKNPTKSPVKTPTMSPGKTPTKSPGKTPTTNPVKNPTKNPIVIPTMNPIATPTKAPVSQATPTAAPTSPTSAPVNPTASSTCTDIPRGCSQFKSDSCSGKSAKWSIQGANYDCNCVSTSKSSKVTFKLKVSSTTVAAFNANQCNAIKLFNGIHSKVYEKTKSSIVSDFPVELEGAAVQQNGDIIVQFNIFGFLDTNSADQVVNYINSNAADFSSAIKAQAGGDVSLSGSASRVDNIAFCGCSKALDAVGSGAISNFLSSSNIIQAIAIGIVANLAA